MKSGTYVSNFKSLFYDLDFLSFFRINQEFFNPNTLVERGIFFATLKIIKKICINL